jgi:ATP synthase protein I
MNSVASPFRTVVRWQLIATAILVAFAALPWGIDGAVSAALGGAVNIVAGAVYGWRVAQGRKVTAADVLQTMFRAWGAKVLAIVALLWLVLSNYRDVVHAAFFLAFTVTVAVFAAAIAVSDTQ